MYDLNGPLGEADSILKQPYSSTTPIFISWNIIPTKAPVELMRVEKFGVCMRLMRVDGILCAHSQNSHQNVNQFKVDESRRELRDKRGRDYFAGLRVTKRNKTTVLLTLTQLQTPTLTLILTLT